MSLVNEVSKTVSDGLLSIENDAFAILRRLITPVVIIYIAANPQTAAVFLIEYFKVDPGVTQVVLLFALPILVGVTVIRAFFIYLEYSFQISLASILGVLKIINAIEPAREAVAKSTTIKAICDWMLNSLENIRRIELKKTANIILTATAIGLLFYLQLGNNFVGKMWNFKFNNELEAAANLHYYCQVTGSYNKDKCDEWLVKRNNLLKAKPDGSDIVPGQKKSIPNQKDAPDPKTVR